MSCNNKYYIIVIIAPLISRPEREKYKLLTLCYYA